MTRIVKTHDERRQEILDEALGLFYAHGYETTSIQHIIDQVGIAKGTFYHYFSSKTDLLDALIDDLVTTTLEKVEPVLDDPDLDALQKLHQFFLNLESWKLANKEFLIDILRAWYSDDNTIFRTRLEKAQMKNFARKFALIIDQGCQEGLFSVSHPQEISQIILAIMQDFSHKLLDSILHPQKNDAQPTEISQLVEIYQQSIEKLLGAKPGSIHILNPDRLKQWF